MWLSGIGFIDRLTNVAAAQHPHAPKDQQLPHLKHLILCFLSHLFEYCLSLRPYIHSKVLTEPLNLDIDARCIVQESRQGCLVTIFLLV